MRISKSPGYHEKACTEIDDCQRRYCPEHRLLWCDCETMHKGYEGDNDVIGGTRAILEFGDCPLCEEYESHKRFHRTIELRHPDQVVCPVCFFMDKAADQVAIHLLKEHQWEYEKARLWLRDKIEEGAFYEKP